MVTRKEITYTTVDRRKLTHVPVGRSGEKVVLIWEDDLLFLQKLGLSMAWTGHIGYVQCLAYLAPGGNIGVARVLMDAKKGQRYLTGIKTRWTLEGRTWKLQKVASLCTA